MTRRVDNMRRWILLATMTLAISAGGCRVAYNYMVEPTERLLDSEREPFYVRYPSWLGMGVGFVAGIPLSFLLVPFLPVDHTNDAPYHMIPSYALGSTCAIILGTPFDLLAYPFHDHSPRPIPDEVAPTYEVRCLDCGADFRHQGSLDDLQCPYCGRGKRMKNGEEWKYDAREIPADGLVPDDLPAPPRKPGPASQ